MAAGVGPVSSFKSTGGLKRLVAGMPGVASVVGALPLAPVGPVSVTSVRVSGSVSVK